MSFSYNGVLVTPMNYLSVFESSSPDVVGEVFLALLNGVDLSKSLAVSSTDALFLQQSRVSLSTADCPEFVSRIPFASVQRSVRDLWLSGVDVSDLSVLGDSVSSRQFVESSASRFVEWFSRGYGVSSFEFLRLPSTYYDVIESGFASGLNFVPVVDYLVFVSPEHTLRYLSSLLSIARVYPEYMVIVEKQLPVDVVEFVAGFARDSWFSSLLSCLSESSSVGSAQYLVAFTEFGISLDASLFGSLTDVQLSWVLECVRNGLPFDRLLDASLSPYECAEVYKAVSAG